METYNFEMTDLFGGEANYAWVKRGSVQVPERKGTFKAHNALVVRRVKKALGLSGVRCRKEDVGETIALYPAGSCTVIFIS